MGMLLRVFAVLIALGCGAWVLAGSVVYVLAQFGAIWAVVAALLAPATLLLVPLYAGVRLGYWLPVVLVYGGGVVSYSLFRLARISDAREA